MRKDNRDPRVGSSTSNMKRNLLFSLSFAIAVLASGCRTYNYRIVEPANLAGTITDKTLNVVYDPLEYRFERWHDRLGMTIENTTGDRVTLRGNASYVVDPKGESHPLRGRTIAPHSYIRMLLPPVPAVYPATSYYDWWGPGFYSGFGYPYSPYWGFPDDFYYGPVTRYYEVITPYDWRWKSGPARVNLSYGRGGTTFEHKFVFVREPAK